MRLTTRRLSLIFALAALLNILPLLLLKPGGDINFQLVMLGCFGEQFWQGDLLPNWCFSANAGLGSPVLLFYFPLPFYATNLFYPLTWLGVDSYVIYILANYALTLVTVATAFIWLRDIVSPHKAALAAIALLFIPYRMEAMIYRVAYSELWCMALLPLLFHYTRKLAMGEKKITGYTLTFAALCLTHLPCTAIAGLFSLVYLLWMTKDWRILARAVTAALLGILLGAFHTLPAIYYRNAISGNGITAGDLSWVNTFFTLRNLHDQPHLVIGIAVTIMAALLLAIPIFRAPIEHPFKRREALGWMMLLALALFLLLPISAPLYALSAPFSKLILPWRIQCIFVLGLGYLAAAYMQWGIDKKLQQNWKLPYVASLGFLTLLALFMVSGYSDPLALKREEQGRMLFEPEYITSWMTNLQAPTRQGEIDKMIAAMMPRLSQQNKILPVRVLSGDASVQVMRWRWDGIELHAQAAQPSTLLLDQLYFPLWQAQGALKLYPQPGSGQMLLDIPAGEHSIALHYSLMANPNIAMLSGLLTVIVAAAILWQARRKTVMP